MSSSATNCQLTTLDVDQTLSTDVSTDSSWNTYERIFSSNCRNEFGGGNGNGGGGILDPSGKIKASFYKFVEQTHLIQ